ncbi:MAG: hypothetical protein Kow0074_15140 [Candidatus Zixiibacteriota bacterium]
MIGVERAIQIVEHIGEIQNQLTLGVAHQIAKFPRRAFSKIVEFRRQTQIPILPVRRFIGVLIGRLFPGIRRVRSPGRILRTVVCLSVTDVFIVRLPLPALGFPLADQTYPSICSDNSLAT